MPNRAAIAAATEHRDMAEEAFHALHFNQELVQFADNKAGTLIVINSLFIAAAQAVPGKSALVMLAGALVVLSAALAIFFCFSVVSTKVVGAKSTRQDLIFFGDIAKRASAEQYASDFFSVQGAQQVEDILRRVYVTATIARRKFKAYATAQMMTGASFGSWVLFNVLALILR